MIFSNSRPFAAEGSEREKTPPAQRTHLPALSHLDFDLDTRRQLQFHQCVDGFGRRRIDVQDTLEGAELELLAGLLVDEGRTVHRKNLLVCRKGHRAAHNGTRALHRLYNLLGRLVHEIVIERL